MNEKGNENVLFRHIPVLLGECISGLNINPHGIYFDGTLGGAGHASEILKKLAPDGILIGTDRDETALRIASSRLKEVSEEAERNGKPCGSFRTVHAVFSQIKKVCSEQNTGLLDGVLLDIGVSSYQLDTKERGFGYSNDSPLDMRMDRSSEFSAYNVVNEYSEQQLADVIYKYGEERNARKIARKIAERRAKAPIRTTFELVDCIKAAVPPKERYAEGEGHCGKRTFQAIRIEVNKELEEIENVIDDAIDMLKPGGRLCIISFHSLEDRIIKQKFRAAENPCTCPPSFPVCVCGKKSKGKIITSKPISASEEELKTNSRSSCAKLRIFERA